MAKLRECVKCSQLIEIGSLCDCEKGKTSMSIKDFLRNECDKSGHSWGEWEKASEGGVDFEICWCTRDGCDAYKTRSASDTNPKHNIPSDIHPR